MQTTVNGLKIEYRDEGVHRDGVPALILLHGWGANTDLFDGIYKFASSKYRVIGPDFPGAGKSEEPAEPMDLDDYVAFVKAFVAKAAPDEKEFIFLGHSHGGRVLIHMAAGLKAGDMNIAKMILVDSAGIVPVKTAAQSERTKKYKRYKEILTRTGLAKAFPGLIDRLQRKFGSADYANATPVMRKTMVNVVNADLTDEMDKITMPVLLIWGSEDTATPLSDGRRMSELMPEAGLAVIPGAGHFSFLENPSHFMSILGSFLQI
ncbi:MAG: alpha/beta hydrolase [Lachnospiraceae bacterium]|nr:alpha/beta hydrolase [Lachnospiraceae bacterium]